MWNATNTSIFGTPSLNPIGLFLGIILAFIGIYKFVLFIIDRKREKIENRLNLERFRMRCIQCNFPSKDSIFTW